MEYLKEVDEIIRICFPKKEHMTNEEHKQSIDYTFKKLNLTKELLSDQIEIGVKNGYSSQYQIQLIAHILKLTKDQTNV